MFGWEPLRGKQGDGAVTRKMEGRLNKEVVHLENATLIPAE